MLKIARFTANTATNLADYGEEQPKQRYTNLLEDITKALVRLVSLKPQKIHSFSFSYIQPKPFIPTFLDIGCNGRINTHNKLRRSSVLTFQYYPRAKPMTAA